MNDKEKKILCIINNNTNLLADITAGRLNYFEMWRPTFLLFCLYFIFRNLSLINNLVK